MERPKKEQLKQVGGGPTLLRVLESKGGSH